MKCLPDPVLPSRLKFAPTAVLHILRPVSTTGLPRYPVVA
jgi:hypothetical protein